MDEQRVILVVGTHPAWHADVTAALAAYPHADVCAVNDAGGLIRADHLATCHPDKLSGFMLRHIERWPDAEIPQLHIGGDEKPDCAWPARRWKITVGGGSAPFAASAMLQIGYEIAILCGCPLNGGDGYAIKGHGSCAIDPRIGSVDPDHYLIGHWQAALADFKEKMPDIAARIRSMSGFTRDLFGGLDGNK